MTALDTPQLFALAASLGWASGMRLYAVVFLTGLAGLLGWVPLPPGLQVLQSPLLLWGSGGLMLVEFLADKIPWVDSAWDALHTFVRVPAGAALAYQVFGGGDAQGWAALAALLGGGLAAGAHLAKATTRVAVNHSPEPFSNIGLSLLGDLTVPGLLYLGWEHPWVLAAVLSLLVVLAAVLTWTLWRFLRGLWSRGWAQRNAPLTP